MSMNTDLSPAPWAIIPAAVESMAARAPGPDRLAAMQATFAKSKPDKDFMLRNGVAIIPITGPIFKRRSLYSLFFGGAALSDLSIVLQSAIADPDVESILLDIDSPGGQVSGTSAFADLVYQARQAKPVVAFANGTMASAAYWIGSSANQVITEKTAQLGSIGVIYMHHDFSQYDAKMGVKRSIISSGKFKGVGNDTEPLTDEARAVIQAEMDEVYGLFVESVSRNRGVSTEDVLTDMADGRVFIGQQAVDAGLADAVGSFDDALQAAGALTTTQPNKPVARRTIQTPAYTPLAGGVDQVLALARVHFGEEAGGRFEQIVRSGISPEGYAAIRPEPQESEEAQAINHAKEGLLAALAQSGAGNPGIDGGDLSGGDFMSVVEETMAIDKIGKTAAMQKVAREQPRLHKQFIMSRNTGLSVNDFNERYKA